MRHYLVKLQSTQLRERLELGAVSTLLLAVSYKWITEGMELVEYANGEITDPERLSAIEMIPFDSVLRSDQVVYSTIDQQPKELMLFAGQSSIKWGAVSGVGGLSGLVYSVFGGRKK